MLAHIPCHAASTQHAARTSTGRLPLLQQQHKAVQPRCQPFGKTLNASQKKACCSASRNNRLTLHASSGNGANAAKSSPYPSNPYATELRETAKFISNRGRGILASDESNVTTGKRLASVGVDNTEDNRRDWRELLYTAPDLGKYISGAIMFEETLYQSCADGRPFVDVLRNQGIMPGIKVDTGLEAIGDETNTVGLDGLSERCAKYYKQGARFAKWRAVLNIANGGPSPKAIESNAHGLAAYAKIAQDNGLVPIVEPEMTLGAGDYTIEETSYWSVRVLTHVFRHLNEHDVMLEGILMKPSMCLPGLDAPSASPQDVAHWTTQTMLRGVPAAVPGIHFLSGGMSEEEATINLQALQEACPNAPWSLTFSYGRALQSATLKAWSGNPENKKKAQDILTSLAKVNSEAQLGKYTGPHPAAGGGRILQALRTGGSGK